MYRRYLWQYAQQGRQKVSQVWDHTQAAWGAVVAGNQVACPSYAPNLVGYPETEAGCPSPTPYDYTDSQLTQYYPQPGWIHNYQAYNGGYYPASQPPMVQPYYYRYPQVGMQSTYTQQPQQQQQQQQQHQQQYVPQHNYGTSSVPLQQRQKLVGTDADVYAATGHFNRWLTKRITETATPRELLLLIHQKGKFFDKVHLSAGFVQAARLKQNKNVNEDKESINSVVEQLCLRATPDMLRLMDGWALSNAMWGLVKTQFHTNNLGRAVAKFLVAEVARKAETFKSQELSITAWSLARMNIHSENVLNEISRVAIQRRRKLGAQAISNTLWAFASLNQYDRELFDSLISATAESFEEFDPQGLSNIMWSLAHMGHYDERFMQQICDFLCRVETRNFHIFPVGISQLVVSLGRLNYRHEELLDRLLAKMVADFTKVDQQTLCNTFFYWALLEQDLAKLQTLIKEIIARYEQGGLEAFRSADLQRLYEGVELFECQGLQIEFPEELLTEAKQHLTIGFQSSATPLKVQDMIHEVVTIIQDMGESATPSQMLEHPVYMLPIGMEIDGKPIAIFAVGQRMYTNTKPHRKLGVLEAKQTVLKHYGWKIVDVPIHDWERLDSYQEQMNYVKKKLNLALGTRKYEVSTGLETENSSGRIVDIEEQ